MLNENAEMRIETSHTRTNIEIGGIEFKCLDGVIFETIADNSPTTKQVLRPMLTLIGEPEEFAKSIEAGIKKAVSTAIETAQSINQST